MTRVPAHRLPPLHLVTDDRVLADPDFLRRAARAIEAGNGRTAIHLRGPKAPGRTLYDHGVALARICEETASAEGGPLLIVNDRVDLALLLGAVGVHLPGAGFPAGVARGLLGEAPLLGLSVHGAGESSGLSSSDREAIDYLFVGTLFETPSHPGRSGGGVERVREVAGVADGLPLIGIGGITPDRVGAVVGGGARGVAVLGAVWNAPDPGHAVEALLAALVAAFGSRTE